MHAFITQLKRQIARFSSKKKGPLVPISHHQQLLRTVRKKRFPSAIQLRQIKRVLSDKEWLIFRSAGTVALLSGLWLLVLALGNFQVVVPKDGGTYTEAVIGEPEHVNPLFASINPVDQDITALVFSGLMRYDKEQQLVPDLAETVEISDDKKTYTFTLKEGLTWHDGRPLTSSDVLFTFGLIQNPQVNSPLRVSFDGVSVQAPDEKTVVFTLKESFNPFLSSLTVGIIPQHVWVDVDPTRVSLAKQNLQPVGSGPFMFKRFAKDDAGFIYRYELKRNETYYNKPPYLDEFIFRFFTEYDSPTGAIIALREKKVDGLSFVPYALRDKIIRKYINVKTLRLPQYTALFFNKDHKALLGDKNVRTALSYAVDKERIITHALKGEAEEIETPVLRGFPGFDEELQGTGYEPSKANDLLDKTWKRLSAEDYKGIRKESLIAQWDEQHPKPEASAETASSTEATPEAGLSDYEKEREQAIIDIEAQLETEFSEAQTFYRKNSDDQILAITITTIDSDEYRKAAQTIAGLWREIGVQTSITYVAPQELKRDTIKSRSYDVLLFGVIVGDNPDQYPFWHSSQVDAPGLNLARYVNRTLDEHLKKARESTDDEVVAEEYKEIQKILLEDVPAIFLYTPTYTYAINETLQGVEVERIFKPSDRFADVAHWFIKTTKAWKK